MTREVIVGLMTERVVMVKPPSRRVWPGASIPPVVILSLRTRHVIPWTGIRLYELGATNIVLPQYRGIFVVLLLHYRYLMGDPRRFDFSLIGFKPNPIIVCSDPHGGDAI